MIDFFRPYGTYWFAFGYPPLKRWAIFKRPADAFLMPHPESSTMQRSLPQEGSASLVFPRLWSQDG